MHAFRKFIHLYAGHSIVKSRIGSNRRYKCSCGKVWWR